MLNFLGARREAAARGGLRAAQWQQMLEAEWGRDYRRNLDLAVLTARQLQLFAPLQRVEIQYDHEVWLYLHQLGEEMLRRPERPHAFNVQRIAPAEEDLNSRAWATTVPDRHPGRGMPNVWMPPPR